MIFLTRAAKYFLSLCVLSTILIAGLFAFGMAAGTPADLMHILFYTTKGWIFIGAVVVLSFLYARSGFMTAYVPGNVNTHREQIAEAFRSVGFVQTGEQDGVLLFRAQSMGRRIMLRFDDQITVRQLGQRIELEGVRKVVVRVESRLESYIRKENE